MTAFLFDNDGVLIDSTELHWLSWKKLGEEDPSFSMSEEEFRYGFGKTTPLILDETFPHVDKETKKRWAERKEVLFRKLARDEVQLLHGMERFLQRVVEAQIPHIIASSTPLKNLEMFLEATHLGRYFAHYISGEEVAHGKPAPDIFIAAAQRLGCDPKECVVFEDAPAGVRAARAAGCFVVALETSYPKEELPTYDLVYPSAQELDLEEILEKRARFAQRGERVRK